MLGWTKEQMADEVIAMFTNGSSVNLGIGMPTIIAERLPAEREIQIHSENGIFGVGERPTAATLSPTLINAGKESVTVNPGASFFDSALSFGMIRGGHIDFCVLGGMEVDVEGSLANWMVPGKKVTGMGGAMDLANGAKHLIVMLQHFDSAGKPKLVSRCTLPLTAARAVHSIVTNLGVFQPCGDYFKIVKLAPHVSEMDLQILTSPASRELEVTI